MFSIYDECSGVIYVKIHTQYYFNNLYLNVILQKPAKYDFKYGVKDDYKGLNFGHEESRDGYATKGETKGSD